MRPRRLAPLLAIALGVPLAAEEAPPAPCSAPEHRQFDFWVGEWEVTNALRDDPGPHAVNRIRLVHGGCALLEEYANADGYSGSSLSYYDAADGGWHQTWIDSAGVPLLMEGGIESGRMVLWQRRDGERLEKTTWTPLPDGRVRQHWERSQDGGVTWQSVFDGTYERRLPAYEP